MTSQEGEKRLPSSLSSSYNIAAFVSSLLMRPAAYNIHHTYYCNHNKHYTMEEQQSANPHALDSAQDPNEVFEIMQPPPANFDPYTDSPVSKMTFTTRGECHERGLWHCSVHIWIVDTASSSILLQKRSMKKDTFPGRVSHGCCSL